MDIRIIGVPSFAGALYSGTEAAPQAIRQAGLLKALEHKELEVVDMGDVAVPSYLPRHNVNPIRNWPAPRIVWEEMLNSSDRLFGEEFSLILGGDCSIVTGTANVLYNKYEEKIYLIVIDGHIDMVSPVESKCIGTAAMGLWFLAKENVFFKKPDGFDEKNIRIVGNHDQGKVSDNLPVFPLEDIQHRGIKAVAEEILISLPEDAKVLLHLDLDVLIKEELYAVYAPSDKGMTLKELESLMTNLIEDKRVIGLEVTEFSAIKDSTALEARKIVNLLANALGALKNRK